ncbi:LytR/AlgR family response regulator transcription factor [Massilia soli]|uniref:LytTR family transcriptional regulator DNA-binding domain-containing protein n=1 Tax=Massilia soli TaxID=2792854 RepID=A0ABS7SQJ3_9BURK|nr:LytTR family transcriptional regulator DNA-binding domain-containing protein [Massilia soli]MBZ2207960.1 LytTR family transcriptional regulator DNA-binding domain-containing protein [Massilia soli]
MRAIVVEDSRLAREGLVRMLGEHAALTVVGQADHPDSALPMIMALRPDVLFLDIHMPGASGFDLLAQLDYLPRIVFTTAFSEYAIRSFDFNTVDYLLKPISAERLAQALHKLLGESDPARAPRRLDIGSKIFIKDGEKCHLVGLDAIKYIESCKNYVQVFFGADKAYVKKSLNSVEERLPAGHFFRANRQCVVNLQAIRSIEESISLGYMITMSDGRMVEVSRRNAIELKELLSF